MVSRKPIGYCDASGAGLTLPSEDRRSLAQPRLAEQFADLLRSCAGQIDDEVGQTRASLELVEDG